MATPYRINIALYEGPLDLLLDLIRKQEMNYIKANGAKTLTANQAQQLNQLLDANAASLSTAR